MRRRQYDPIPDLTLALAISMIVFLLIAIGEGWIK